jgi:hypothetical protein
MQLLVPEQRSSAVGMREPVYAAGIGACILTGLSLGGALMCAAAGEFHQVGELLNTAMRFGNAARRLYDQTINLQMDRQLERAMLYRQGEV